MKNSMGIKVSKYSYKCPLRYRSVMCNLEMPHTKKTPQVRLYKLERQQKRYNKTCC